MRVAIEISDDVIESCLVSAIEGGMMRSWCSKVVRADKKKIEGDFPFYKVMQGACWYVYEFAGQEGDHTKTRRHYLNAAKLKKSIQLMAEKYPHHLRDLIDDGGDAITGDVFVQLAILGGIKYG